MSTRRCGCGAKLPRQTGPGRPRIFCDTCRNKRNGTARYAPNWTADPGSILAIIDASYSYANTSDPVALAIARNLAARIDGLPTSQTRACITLTRTLQTFVAILDRCQTQPQGPDALDEFSRRRLQLISD